MIFKMANKFKTCNTQAGIGADSEMRKYFKIFPKDQKVGEVWFGDHITLPSSIELDGKSILLYHYISKGPTNSLGKEIYTKFGDIPFLSKMIITDQSLKIHPSKEQAIAGFEREEKLGIPLGVPDRMYKDKNGKNKIIIGLTNFHLLKGFRGLKEIETDLASCRLQDLFTGDHKGTFNNLANVTEKQIESVLNYARRHDNILRFEKIVKLHEQHGFDVGVVAPLYLHTIHLRPFRMAIIPSNILHAYLDGIAFEVGTNSDNTIQMTLTEEHSSYDEVVDLIKYEEDVDNVPHNPTKSVYEREDFFIKLSQVTKSRSLIHENRTCEIVFNIGNGNLFLNDDTKLLPGESAFIDNGTREYSLKTLDENCKIFIVGVNS